MKNNCQLFSPIQVGAIPLEHRVVMAPLTRMRSEQPGDVPGDLMAEYYGQRTSEGGLIITESTEITPDASAYEGAPGIYSDAQVEGWHKVTRAVHEKGGFVFMQLWHPGRVSNVELAGGVTPVGASAIAAKEIFVFTARGPLVATPNRALEKKEIPGIIELYRSAAGRAKAAGFDGVEVLAAGGYLIDQFLENGTNHRTDEYGGSVENRARFLIEVIAAAASVWDTGRIGVRISPGGTFNSISDSQPEAIFGHVAERLNPFNLAYLHIIEPRVRGGTTVNKEQPPIASAYLRNIFQGKILAAGGFNPDSAKAIVEKGDADMVAFGRHFISNPDLPKRIASDSPLTPYDRSTFYGGDHRGYTDYAFTNE